MKREYKISAVGLFMLFATFIGGCSDDSLTYKPLPPYTEEDIEPPTPGVTVLRIVDANATAETKALHANLWRLQNEKKFMFGHHDGLIYGRAWQYVEGRSDTKDVCGDFEAVFSLDFAEMTDNRNNPNSTANRNRIRTMKEAWARGSVITACIHINNPHPNGTDSWDNSAAHSVFPDIITSGTAINLKFLGWLDNLASMANNLKDDNGTLIPVIFRPFHEHTQEWSWWGPLRSTEAEFISLWQMTVKYLRDVKGVHNFLYAISPQMDRNYETGTRARLLFRWPGDNYVDFIGMDCYHGSNWGALRNNLVQLELVSQEKLKPCGVTETGEEGFTRSDYWTRGVVEPFADLKVGMIVMWRNKYVGNINSTDTHYFSVYKGHPSESDFNNMYALPNSLFSSDLRSMYVMPEGYDVRGY